MLSDALGRFSSDIAVDLGSTNTRVYVRGRGVAVEAPSVVAVEKAGSGRRVVAFGDEAKRMLGRTPEHITAIRPIQGGVIEDYELAQALVADCVQRGLGGRRLVRPRMVVCVPHATADVERRAVQEFARVVGARTVHLLAKSAAAAVGAEVPVHEALGNVVVDIGGGITEAVVISLGGIVDVETVRIAGADMDRAVAAWVKERHNILIGTRTAEEIKLQVGAVGDVELGRTITVTGRDLTTGIPREVKITSADLREPLQGPLDTIVDGVRRLLSRLSPELAADVSEQGLVLSGGGALLRGIDGHVRKVSGLPVVLSEDPPRGTILGAGALLAETESLDRLAL